MDVLLFGPPGAGKGTQATAVTRAAGVPHVSTGDIFRRHMKQGTELGVLARKCIDKGQLVPDDVVVDLVMSRLAEDDAGAGVLLDGFPRTVAQAEALVAWLGVRGRRIDAVIRLVVQDQVVVARLAGRRTCLDCGASYHHTVNPPARAGLCDQCGGDVVQRSDDSEATVQARIETYHRQTAPVLDWLQGRVGVHPVDADQSILQVEDDILSVLPRARR